MPAQVPPLTARCLGCNRPPYGPQDAATWAQIVTMLDDKLTIVGYECRTCFGEGLVQSE